MAGDQNGDAIEGAGAGYGAGCVGVAQLAGQLAVGAGFAAGNLTKGLPDAELEDSPSQVQGIYPAPAFGQIAALAHALERRIDEPRE